MVATTAPDVDQIIFIVGAERGDSSVDEKIVIFRKRYGNVRDISYFGTPVATRGHGAIGKGQVKDVEEDLSQPT